jgi:uncharacterized protein (TIGR00251 family)
MVDEVELKFKAAVAVKPVEIEVVPDSKKRNISYDEKKNKFIVSVKAEPENNEANEEIIQYLSKISNKKIKILVGRRSKKKVVY